MRDFYGTLQHAAGSVHHHLRSRSTRAKKQDIDHTYGVNVEILDERLGWKRDSFLNHTRSTRADN